MSRHREEEFEELARFLSAFYTLTTGQTRQSAGNAHPRNALDSIAAEVGKSRALVGLRQAVNDQLTMSADFDSEAIAMIDSVLTKSHVTSLTEMRRKYWRKVASIRKRRKIKNDTEYHLVKGLAGGDDELIALLEQYEHRSP